MKFVIPIENQFHWDTVPRNKELKLQVDHHCNAPSRRLLIDWKGDCFVCGCELWLPISVGKITDFERLEDVWSSPTAQALQQSIDNRTFDNCAVTRCGVMHYDMIETEYTISINIDESCNLRCPSCRTDAVMITSGDKHEEKLAWANHLVDMLEQFEQPCRIIMSGNGDPLASSVMRPLLHRYRPRPNQWIKLFTNGLLIRKQLTDNPVLAHIDEYLISIDAGSAEVYEQIRLGGRWDLLLDNFKFLKEHTQHKNLGNNHNVALTMVMQKNNYNDMKNFCELCVQFGFLGSITKLEDWGTWQDFITHDVLNPAHPEHDKAAQALKSVYEEYSHCIFFHSALQQFLGVNQQVNPTDNHTSIKV
jgi:molybdenum cofactor biosynthesis enzyme MoaA